jgi:hypothetical protein
LHEATQIEMNPLGTCQGKRPWLGRNTAEECSHKSRLLIRTASNAYFPQVISVLSLPDRGSAVENAVTELWDLLQAVDSGEVLAAFKRLPRVMQGLAGFGDSEVLDAIGKVKKGAAADRPVKQVELDALLAVPEGFGDDVPVDQSFHARRLPDRVWRRTDLSRGIAAVTQVHRLREVLALVGFTRFEAVTPDIDGEYETDVERASSRSNRRGFRRWRTAAKGSSSSSGPRPSRNGWPVRRSSTASMHSPPGTGAGRTTARASDRSRADRTCCSTRCPTC